MFSGESAPQIQIPGFTAEASANLQFGSVEGLRNSIAETLRAMSGAELLILLFAFFVVMQAIGWVGGMEQEMRDGGSGGGELIMMLIAMVVAFGAFNMLGGGEFDLGFIGEMVNANKEAVILVLVGLIMAYIFAETVIMKTVM